MNKVEANNLEIDKYPGRMVDELDYGQLKVHFWIQVDLTRFISLST